jgi:two-component system response regulator VicR
MASYVLVVDDEKPIRDILRRRLEGWGYVVKEAANASAALELMLAERAAFAIVDIRMPGHDGLWLVEQIRERWHIPIIMATGADDMASVERSRQLGAIDYVLKPFDRELLRQAVTRAEMAKTDASPT